MTDPIPAWLYTDPPLPTEVVEAIVDGMIAGRDPVYYEDETEDHPTPWAITDDRTADWAMRLYAQADRDLAEAGERATEWHAQIDRWLTDAGRRPAQTMAFFGHHLEAYQRGRREADPKAATLLLPSGSVPSRKRAEHVAVTDSEDLVFWAWANHRPDLLKMEPRLASVRESAQIEDRVDHWWFALSCGCEDTMVPPVAGASPASIVGAPAVCAGHGSVNITIEEARAVQVRAAVDKKSGEVIPGTEVVDEGFTVGPPKPTGSVR
jgi:hypothetical protein